MAKQLFTSEKQPLKRRPRGKDKRTMLLAAIMEATGHNEDQFWKEAVRRAMDPADPASSMLMKEVLTRLYPNSKPTMPIIEFEFRKEGTPADKVDDISNAVSDGILPVDVAKTMVDIIKQGLEIVEVTELAERLERLERMLNEKAPEQ